MAFVNQETREIQLKIVYYGPARCGKTTNLEVVHRLIKPDHKGDLTSLDTVKDRLQRYARLHLGRVEQGVTFGQFQLFRGWSHFLEDHARQAPAVGGGDLLEIGPPLGE